MDHESAMTNPNMAKEMEADMRRRFFISLLLTIPIVLYSPMGEMLFGILLPSPIPKNLLLFILTTPIVFWTGSIFITGTYYSLKARKLNMSVLIATGVLAAYIGSIVLAFHASSEAFYEAAAMLVIIANVLTIILVTTEINQYFARQMLANGQITSTTVSIFWALYAIGALLYGIKQRSKMLRVGGLTFFFITILKVITDVWSLGDLYRIISFVAVGVIALGGSFVYLKYKDKLQELV
jgi:uncharacterized membrane protein